MQNSPGIPLAALVVAIALAIITTLSVIAGVGGGVALNELQIGAANHAAVRCGPSDRALPGIPLPTARMAP